WFKKNNIKLEKLQDFWELLLTRDDLDKDVYSEFGFWINDKVDIFDDYKWLAEMIAETLTKSKGKIDRDNGLLDRLPEFAESNPDQTLIILNKFFIEGIFGDSNSNKWVHIDNKIISVFEKLYMYDKAKTKALINKLLPKGGRRFWPLKDIVDK
ncbi:hypothetical protein KKG71_04495, partial [Patescibacteria group bacterium]|nr:hypothetical protein [Patescibacteria group bacterium]